MVFHSPQFILFLIGVVLVWQILPGRFRRYWMLLASVLFYGLSSWQSLPSFLLLALLGYGLARWTGKTEEMRNKRGSIAVAVFVCLFVLLKLVGGFWQSEQGKGILPWLIPLGYSYFFFAVIGYLVDVKRGTTPPITDLVTYGLLVGFFPQALSGPIARTETLRSQYEQAGARQEDDLSLGFEKFLMGFFRKVAVADMLGILVSSIYAEPTKVSSLSFLVAVLLYPLQLYFDFAGYSDMAIGCAQMMGIHLQENFSTPYFSRDMRELWRRWHISLSEWLRDYIYFPLGGSRKGEGRRVLNAFVVFLVCGFWHGVQWRYLLWGLLMAVGQQLGTVVSKKESSFMKKVGPMLTYCYWAVCLVLFSHPLSVLRERLQGTAAENGWQELSVHLVEGIKNGSTYSFMYPYFYWIALLGALCFCWVLDYRWWKQHEPGETTRVLQTIPTRRRWKWMGWMLALGLLCYFLTISGNMSSAFIYVGY